MTARRAGGSARDGATPSTGMTHATAARRIESAVTAVLVTMVTAFVLINLRPWLWVLDTTPTGGDLGAHVWAPAYLRDELLGDLRLTGWSHDWYAGFPAFTFYMVIPSLLVLLVESGIPLPVDVYAHTAAAACAVALGWHLTERRGRAPGEDGCPRSGRSPTTLPSQAAFYGAVPRPKANNAASSGTLPSQAAFYGAVAALAAMQALERLDGRTIDLPGVRSFVYADTPVDRFLAAVLLPIAVGWLVWAAASSAFGSATIHRYRLLLCTAAVTATLAATPMPYGVAFKLVAIVGVAALPMAAYLMARVAGLAFPGPALAATAVVPFVFDRSYNIYGGNLMSTMAGEFAYSLGLACAVLYIGAAARGMSTGRDRVLAGSLLALTGLTHLFPAFLALAVTGMLLVSPPWNRAAQWMRLKWTTTAGALAAALSAWWVLPFLWNRSLLNDMGWGKERRYLSALWTRTDFDYDFLLDDPPLRPFVLLAAAGVVACLMRRTRLTMALAGTAGFFALVFVMLPEGRLWNVRILPFYYFSIYMTAFLGLGEVVKSSHAIIRCLYVSVCESSLVRRLRRSRSSGNSQETASWEVPEAIGGSDGGSGDHASAEASGIESDHDADGSTEDGDGCTAAASESSADRAGVAFPSAAAILATIAVLISVGLPLRGLPGGNLNDAGGYEWGPFETRELNLGPSWLQYNYEGYEKKKPTSAGGGHSEYRGLVDTMADVAESHGCGISFWEYEAGRLGSYGTPMAPMLLPFWTDSCIGSMEGLYFEASSTTPYHFLMQSELSAAPSRAQRGLPYSHLDVAAGVRHLELMGVRYYLAFSSGAVAQARSAEGLTEISGSGPWSVFLVDGSDPVVGLGELPVVLEGVSSTGDAWLEVAVGAFSAADGTPLLLAADGPDGWPRLDLAPIHDELREIRADPTRPGSPRERAMRHLAEVLSDIVPREAVAAPARVSGIVRGNHSISFSVDRVGVPVLVRTSYFPNWSVSGAHGPYRVTPNLMAVVPTDTEVRLSYDRSPVELSSMLVTLAGLVAAVWLSRRPFPLAGEDDDQSR